MGNKHGSFGGKRKTVAHAMVDQNFLGIATDAVDRVGSIFDGMEVYIVTGCGEYDKKKLETIVVQHGGGIVQNPGPRTTFVVADRASMCRSCNLDVRVKNIVKGGRFDIVRSIYLLDCAKRQRKLDLDPSFMFHTLPKTRRLFIEHGVADEFDDVYKMMHTPESVKRVCLELLNIS